MTDALRQTLRTKLSELTKFSVGTLLLFTAAAGAHAQSGNDTLKNTNYNISIGDVNGDGREDILMKAVPRIVVIPLDDDLTIPIAIPAKTPSFALISDAYWGYVLVPNPDTQLLQSNWSAASSGTLQFGANGQHADTVRIQSASGEFIIAFSDVSQQLSLVQQPGVVKVPGTVTYIHTDGLGSPVARTNAAGQLLSRTLYEPYGYVAMGETPTIGFTGHVNDADTGLTYMQQRYYDPVVGRFLSIDPVTTDANTGGSFNRYAYAANNPYKYIDPDGRQERAAEAFGDQFRNDVAAGNASVYEPFRGPAIAVGIGVLIGPPVAAAIIAPAEATVVAGAAGKSAVQALKLEKSLASEAQTARLAAGKGEVIAGAGTKTPYRDAGRLAEQHGGKVGDWQKVSGGNHVAKDGTKIETHAAQNRETKQVVEFKTKLRDEGQP